MSALAQSGHSNFRLSEFKAAYPLRTNADRQPREAIAPALAGYFLRGTRRVAARRAEHHKYAPEEAPQNSPPDRLGSLTEPRHACYVTVRVECLVMSARFECLRAAFVEDHLVPDVVIALLI